jgi:hypothetical protein
VALVLVFSFPLIADCLLLGPHAGEWTVYKPAPDWRRAAAWFDDNVPIDPPPVVLERSPSDALAHYYPSLRRARLQTWPPSAARLEDLARRFDVREFYLVSNTFWFPLDPELLSKTAPLWQAVPVLEARSLRLYLISSR